MEKAPTPIERIVKAMCEAERGSVDYGYLVDKTALSRRTVMQAINRASTRQTGYFEAHGPGVYSLTQKGKDALCAGCVHRPKTPTKPLKHMLEGATGIRAIVWKLVRMKRTVTVPDCMVAVSEYAKQHSIKNAKNQVHVYLNALVRGLFVFRRGKLRAYQYTLVYDPGPKAPVVSAGGRGRIYEPNKGEWIEGLKNG